MKIENLKNIVDIDGSYGSGGGQILRTSLALSLLTKRPFKLRHIRVKRKNPGLAAQHLACVNVAKELSEAYEQGATIGSRELLFVPKHGIEKKSVSVDIGTAGSIPLVLQMLMPSLIEIKNFSAQIIGGTDVANAPSADYLQYVLLPLLKKFGYNANIKIERRGFYPKGGGRIIFEKFDNVEMPQDFSGFNEKGKLLKIRGKAIATEILKERKVVERMHTFVLQWLKTTIFDNLEVDLEKEYCQAYSDGAVLTLWLETAKSVIGASNVGERQKPSEVLARETAQMLQEEVKGAIDRHAGDQLLPFLAYLANKYKKKLSLKTSLITDHIRTNAYVITKFLPVDIMINEAEAIIEISPLSQSI